jgi:hypothetical protein
MEPMDDPTRRALHLAVCTALDRLTRLADLLSDHDAPELASQVDEACGRLVQVRDALFHLRGIVRDALAQGEP